MSLARDDGIGSAGDAGGPTDRRPGLEQGNFSSGRLPTRLTLTGHRQHPVLLMRFFNTDLANSHALPWPG
jgi:hypothetical protein